MPRPLSRPVLLEGLAAAADSFDRGELSYLALTSKAEHVVRDRLAWALSKQGHRVAREWRARGDLAVLDDRGEPLAALESKATYTHDTVWGKMKGFAEMQRSVGGVAPLEVKLRADAAKVLLAAGPSPSYVLLIAMHRQDSVPVELRETVSEADRLPRDWRVAKQQLLGYLRPLGPVSPSILLGNGSAFGIRMSVTGWLCGPLKPIELWHTPA
ncbi:MAG: hypothetical protein ACRDQZ_14050 [Mycobacteriales bacterium]